ncbi:TetR/AcrR family transcriptional regulator [Microbacterium sp. Au-Mic1]|uniref:TetR/AcrR family transcriptional regulator n=1 Tax=Microbacterium sp. Au-Mic1 TaxID=2906457 RepID=UPI001E3950BB|nr:TetR/AcrR family transcriptional regulator [Microbacterium sp. Au-Mic1]MCE4026742.1 TetR/AcrR family transcriptional regulator [Microbacterium sp. Au-Mic1]
MTTFQRARTEEQREVRRRAILDTAAAMLTELPLADVSLNELSRRVGLAKSNVLRYFESREAVLLDLLGEQAAELFAEVHASLPGAIDARDDVRRRVAATASVLASAFARHEMLCELIAAQAGVLEHNVTTDTIVRFKRNGYEALARFGALVRQVIPELTEPQADEAARSILIAVGGYWTHTHPPQAVHDAYALDATLVFLPEQFQGSLARIIEVLILGTLAA